MPSRLPVFFIVMTVVIDAMGIGLIVPVMPELIQKVHGGNIGNAAIWGGILATSFAVMQFLFSPVLGALSDSFGRRPVLLVSLLVMAADYVVMALAGSIWLLLAGRIIGGITAATHSTAMAYMADVSAPHEKAARFGLIGAGFGIGFVIGPVLGGLLADYGTRAPFWAAAALALANAALGFFVLGETITAAKARAFEWRRANPFGALRSVARLDGLKLLLLVFFFFNIATHVYPAVWAYFGAERFSWPASTIGLSLGLYGIGFAFAQGVLVRPAIRRLGPRRAVMLGMCSSIASFLLLTFITDGTLLLWLIPFFSLGAIAMPALQGTLSQAVPDNAQGELQGVLGSLSSLSMILSPVIMTQTFAYFSRQDAGFYLPGAPFLLAALIMGFALILYITDKSARQIQNAT